jgi:hypothetical protein
MISIDAVTITARFALYSRGVPDPDSHAILRTSLGGAYVGHWRAGILSLPSPDGGRSEITCSDVDAAIHEATLVWDTPEGKRAIARQLAEREADRWRVNADVAAATWTGERRHEWQEPKQLVPIVKTAIQQAVKDGILPLPNDYRVTWRKDENAIYIRTKHAWMRYGQITETVRDLLRPFNASRPRDSDGDVFEGRDFDIEIAEPTGLKPDRSLPHAERMALTGAHRIAAMEQAGFPAADIDDVRKFFAAYAPAA